MTEFREVIVENSHETCIFKYTIFFNISVSYLSLAYFLFNEIFYLFIAL